MECYLKSSKAGRAIEDIGMLQNSRQATYPIRDDPTLARNNQRPFQEAARSQILEKIQQTEDSEYLFVKEEFDVD